MARYLTMIGAALATLGTAAPVVAQSVESDVRCLLAANVFARQEKDPAKKQLAVAASLFYLGRLDARMSIERLKVAMLVQAKAMPASSLGPTMTTCAKHLLELNVSTTGQPTPAPSKPK